MARPHTGNGAQAHLGTGLDLDQQHVALAVHLWPHKWAPFAVWLGSAVEKYQHYSKRRSLRTQFFLGQVRGKRSTSQLAIERFSCAKDSLYPGRKLVELCIANSDERERGIEGGNYRMVAEPNEASHDARKRRDFFATWPMRAADILRKALPIDEAHYQGVVGYAHRDARAYLLYGAMDEVFKVCTATLRWAEFLDVPEEESKKHDTSAGDTERHMRRVVIEAVLDEQHMWIRKLNELLSDLILFQSTNEQDYYRLYLASRFLAAYLCLQRDFEEFFAFRNGNADVTIRDVLAHIEAIQKTIDRNKVWFLTGLISAAKPPRPGGIFTSARRRFILAVGSAEADQRTALGISYEGGHSVPSRSLHSSIGDPGRRETERDEMDINIGRLGLLTGHITVIAHKLAGIEPTGAARDLATALGDSDGPKAFAEVIQAEFEVGDIVFAYGNDVCQIIDRAKSKYGYTSYKVRYLSRPMLAELPEDWFSAREIRLIIPHKGLRRRVSDLFKFAGANPEQIAQVDAVSDAEMSRLVAKAIREWEAAGILPRLLGYPKSER
jgi:hypothetical protein